MKAKYSTWKLTDDELGLVLDALYSYQSIERMLRPRKALRIDALRRRLLSGFVAAAGAAAADELGPVPLPEST